MTELMLSCPTHPLEFGFGLSYSKFSYSGLNLKRKFEADKTSIQFTNEDFVGKQKGDSIYDTIAEVSIDIKNDGDVLACEVAQLVSRLFTQPVSHCIGLTSSLLPSSTSSSPRTRGSPNSSFEALRRSSSSRPAHPRPPRSLSVGRTSWSGMSSCRSGERRRMATSTSTLVPPRASCHSRLPTGSSKSSSS